MKRRNFVLAALGAAPLAYSFRFKTQKLEDKKPFAVKVGEGRYHGHIQLKGVNVNIQDVKISGKDTNGALAIFEQTGRSPKRGVPLHVHPNQDEIFQILEGEYHFLVNNEKFQLRAGESIFLPRNVPHAWTQKTETGKATVILQPAGKLEEFFVYMASLKSEPTKEEIAQIFIKHDMQVVGPPFVID